MTTEAATKILNGLLDQRDQLVARSVKLADERQKISFAAHTGDAKARDKLRKLNDESVLHNAELESLDAAIAEANVRLKAAEATAVLAADHANALALRAKIAALVEAGTIADDALADAAESIRVMLRLLDDIHALGQQAPTSEQLRVNGTACIKTMLQQLPQLWVRDFDFSLLAPNQKKTFRAITTGWHDMIERSIAQRLQTTEAA